ASNLLDRLFRLPPQPLVADRINADQIEKAARHDYERGKREKRAQESAPKPAHARATQAVRRPARRGKPVQRGNFLASEAHQFVFSRALLHRYSRRGLPPAWTNPAAAL